jgi:putative acetyltransferase
MIIRRETKRDFEKIYNLVKIAFQTANVSNGKEQDFVSELRNSDNYIPEMALVVEEDDKLIGHIMLTKNYVRDKDSKVETLLLAPISVALKYRNKGIGYLMINESFKIAKNMGYGSVVLVGDPAYYSRFGFMTSTIFGIKCLDNIPEKYVMACELFTNALKEINGTIEF